MAGRITYYTYDLMTSALLAELPFTGVNWSQQLNDAGSWSGSLDLADPKIQNLNPLTGTNPARTLMIVDIDGVIVWGGILWTRRFDSASRILSLSASEAWSYFSKRLQSIDYTAPPTATPGSTYWSANPAPSEDIAAALVADALAEAGSAFSSMTVQVVETQTNTNGLTGSFPITQRRDMQSMVSLLMQGGYLTGFDLGIDWQWSGQPGSTPTPTITFSYPRRGRIAGSTGLIIDAATAASYQWSEDGGSTANSVRAKASGAGVLETTAADPGPISAGYPLLEKLKSYISATRPEMLNAAANGYLSQIEWPITAPAFVLPMFGTTLAIGDFLLGDDSRVIVPPDERFPLGLDTYMRITGVRANPADAGESQMTLTLGLVPALAPVPAPPQ